MSKILYSGAILGAVALLNILSFGSSAEASNILNCKGDNASKVTACCEQAVSENGRPGWMVLSRTNCSQTTICIKKKCFTKAVYLIERKSHDSDRGGKK